MGTLVDAVERLCTESGPLALLPGFGYRPQQHQMALHVASALEENAHIIIEAPTGVGKTLGYLIPAALSAIHGHRTALISTHTKTLQEQILQNDIPRLRAVLGPGVTAATLKGRRNYLCPARLAAVRSEGMLRLDDALDRELQALESWADRSHDGDIEHLGFSPRPEIWDLVCAEQGFCSPSSCSSRCFHRRAWDRARHASLVVLNHALFFQLLSLRGDQPGLLGENDIAVLDEAHTIEAVAREGFGKRISRRGILQAVHRLYHPRHRTGLLARHSPRGLRSACTAVGRELGEFFRALPSVIPRVDSTSTRGLRQVRIRSPLSVDRSVVSSLAALASRVRNARSHESHETLAGQLAAAAERLEETAAFLEEVLDVADAGRTYWFEADEGAEALCAAPRNTADLLGPGLFRKGMPVVLTSATLSIEGSLAYVRSRLGTPADIRESILDSPFDYRRQMRLTVVPDMPEPEDPRYASALHAWLVRSIDRTHGRALILFTSIAALEAAATALEDPCAERGIALLVQGRGRPRNDLLDTFREDTDSVLLGLDSYWSGVDVPGTALEHVIITRLPFSVPNHPLVEARLEDIERNGGNPFLEATLPEAVLKFRQGVGRLIRSVNDSGIVTILDSRLARKPYGRVFLASLPSCPIETLAADGTLETVVPDY